MGLDLALFSISNKAKFVLEKAKVNEDYANDFDKIQDTNKLRLHLRMIQSNPDGTPEKVLKELIEDSKVVLSHYPDNKIDKFQFFSQTRGYETLNYLLIKFFVSKNIDFDNTKLFFGGIDIINNSQYLRFQYFDNLKTLEISNLLQAIDFSDIVKFYDYDEMENTVYKLLKPENLTDLKGEFEELKAFFNEAKLLNAFVVIKIS
ncbi:DUF1877 family protein [Chryseobacterium luquanense]|uniref:YfbM family protein n=1 Tax=Chryseobacterium luquanense TaxID=2983766 RepID=A0ABT3Y7B7_9FLAO|nr:DUF1877 family protein [Chryseobacterium luquanense]MCX8534058.1 YfbM family protein [Chryseobacterium luquanense]